MWQLQPGALFVYLSCRPMLIRCLTSAEVIRPFEQVGELLRTQQHLSGSPQSPASRLHSPPYLFHLINQHNPLPSRSSECLALLEVRKMTQGNGFGPRSWIPDQEMQVWAADDRGKSCPTPQRLTTSVKANFSATIWGRNPKTLDFSLKRFLVATAWGSWSLQLQLAVSSLVQLEIDLTQELKVQRSPAQQLAARLKLK